MTDDDGDGSGRFGPPEWDDGRLSERGDAFGPGEAAPALYHVAATVVDTEGRKVERGEEFEAEFRTAARTEQYAIARAEMFFQSRGFEVVSEFDIERVEVGRSPDAVLEHLAEKFKSEDADGVSWI